MTQVESEQPGPSARAGTIPGSPAWNPTGRGQTGISDIAALAERTGLRRVHIVAWRDLDDPEAGGSELHAHRVAELWAAAGVDVSVRTSRADGLPAQATRSGYSVVRKSGRYLAFPRTILSAKSGRSGSWDGLVEIWNGMPFLSPLWHRGPRVVFLHHVHGEMWDMVLPKPLAGVGKLMERKLAPPLYRRTRVVTLSDSSRSEIVEMLGIPEQNVTVVPPGIEGAFSPGGHRSLHPLVVAVGRLVPVKRFEDLIEALVVLRLRHPTLEAMIIGEGYLRRDLETRIARHGAGSWLRLAGRVDDATLLAAYRRAWLVASTSAREGWGMTLTEAAACGTPAVVTRTVGHRDAVVHGQTGFLAEDMDGLVDAMHAVVSDPKLRARLGAGALSFAQDFTWEATAHATFAVLADEAAQKNGKSYGALRPVPDLAPKGPPRS